MCTNKKGYCVIKKQKYITLIKGFRDMKYLVQKHNDIFISSSPKDFLYYPTNLVFFNKKLKFILNSLTEKSL